MAHLFLGIKYIVG